MTARQGDEKKPLLDTGASHILLQLDLLDESTAEEARRILVHQATGKPKRALLLKGVTYAAGVVRPLVSVGALKEKLGLHFAWAREQPSLMMARMDGIGRQEIIRGKVDGRLPILEYELFEVFLRAYSDVHDGKTWEEKCLAKGVGGRLGVFSGRSNSSNGYNGSSNRTTNYSSRGRVKSSTTCHTTSTQREPISGRMTCHHLDHRSLESQLLGGEG